MLSQYVGYSEFKKGQKVSSRRDFLRVLYVKIGLYLVCHGSSFVNL